MDLLGSTIEELEQFAAEMGEKPFRGKQLFAWISRGERDFDEMTDLSKPFRQKLKDRACIGGARIIDAQVSEGGDARKFLYGFVRDGGPAADGDLVEGVLMKYRYGNSLCVSSQIGCKMGCRFCASAIGGFVRNLTAGEMLAQVHAAERASGEDIDHIVVMGMGEPFDNYDNLARFLRILHEPAGRNMSYRNMTVSTSGIIPAMDRFAADFPSVSLAVSLHCLTDRGRSRLMPVNRSYPLDELLEAARRYTVRTGRRITFEYALIKGENDGEAAVRLMLKKLGGMLCHVNLIPLNEVKESAMTGSSRRRAEEIAVRLNRGGIPATVRRKLGGEIEGACGQLRRGRLACGIEREAP